MDRNCEQVAAARHILKVTSFEALIGARFTGDINAICWARQLPGDFGEIVDRLPAGGGVTSIADRDLIEMTLTPSGSIARDILLDDLARLRANGLAPSLERVSSYPRDTGNVGISTDVYSYHVDTATDEADTFLCTYAGATTEALFNEDAIRRVDVEQTRSELLKLHGDADDETFAGFLSENCFDLHYQARSGCEPYRFGLGNMWRIAIEHPRATVPACIHRAPVEFPADTARLLLIS